ncbi:hypothetical protein CXG81DRAFT_3057, partial [Caulochytrium protostelioides]
LPLADQELLLVEDMLFVFLGYDGRFVRRIKRDHLMPSHLQRPSGAAAEINYLVDATLDPSLGLLASRLLALTSAVRAVTTYVELHTSFGSGLLDQALAAAMRRILNEWGNLVAGLEEWAHRARPSMPAAGDSLGDDEDNEGPLTLQKIWFHVQPALETFRVLRGVLDVVAATHQQSASFHDGFSRAESLSGLSRADSMSGANTAPSLLQVLHHRLVTYGGDPHVTRLHRYLLHQTSIPFLDHLVAWLNGGELLHETEIHGHASHIADKSDIFMITERRSLRKAILRDDFNDLYWDQRYILRWDRVPPALEHVAEKVLLAGKYLNVIRECGDGVNVDISQIPQWLSLIHSAYFTANHTLLRVLYDQAYLMTCLRTVKSFFFMERAEVMMSFLENVGDEIVRPVKEIALDRVRSMLEVCVKSLCPTLASATTTTGRTIDGSEHGYAEGNEPASALSGAADGGYNGVWGTQADMAAQLAYLRSQPLTGLSALTLTFTPPFPLTLILNKKALTKYQLLFRFVLKCKVLGSSMGSAWLRQRKIYDYDAPQMANMITRVAKLRSGMHHILQQLDFYTSYEAAGTVHDGIHPAGLDGMTVDEVLTAHNAFLDTCLKECMLTTPKLLLATNHLMDYCSVFIDFVEY